MMYRKKICLSVVMVVIFLMLNIDLWQVRNSPEVFRDPDEAWYGIVIKHIATDGCQGVPVSYNFQNRINFHSCRFLEGLGHLFPIENALQQTALIKFTSRFVVVLGFGLLSWAFFADAILGALLGLALYLDGGIYTFKPALITAQNLVFNRMDEFTRFNRFISPMQYQVVLLFWIFLFIHWIFAPQKFSARMNFSLFLITTVVGGLVSFTPFYAWVTYFIAVFWLLVFGWKKMPRRFWWAAVLSFSGTVLLSFLQLSFKAEIPFASEVLPRSAFFNHQWQPLFVADKGLIFGMLCLGFFIFLISRQKVLSLIVPLSFYLLVNINFFTGKEYQNLHFKDYLGPLWFLTLVFISTSLFFKKRNLIYGILIGICLLGLTQHLHSQLDRPSFIRLETQRSDFSEISNFFKNKTGPKVFCGDFYQILPLITPVRCSWHHLLMTYPLSNEELMKQSMAQWRLSGLSDLQTQERLAMDALPTRSLGCWSFGNLNSWVQGYSETEMYNSKNILENIIPKWMKEYEKFNVAMALRELGPVEYLVLPKKFATENSIFEATAVFSEYGIYTVKK